MTTQHPHQPALPIGNASPAPLNGATPPAPSLSETMTARVLANVQNGLQQLGARYAIRLPDGTTLGDLLIAPDPPPPRKRGPRRATVFKFGRLVEVYRERVAALQPCTVAVVSLDDPRIPRDPPLDDDHLARMLRSGMSSYAVKLWGRGSHTTNYNEAARTVELMRER